MSAPNFSLQDAAVIVFASFGNDAGTLARVIERTGARARVCERAEDIGGALQDETAAILATEESLQVAAAPIRACLDAQPPWSDVPVIVLSGSRGRTGTAARWQFFRQFGNVTVLDRPISAEALALALEAACRARGWQYVVRDQMGKLEAQNAGLEKTVRDRTEALRAEIKERERIEGALNEARRLEAIGRLAGGVAHDFNNLLQIISGACDMMPYVRDDPARTQSLWDTIGRATQRGSKLTQQMLAFGRRQMLSSDSIDIAQHVTEMKELLQQSLREKITLELRLQADLWRAKADVTQLEVALLNLTINAKDVLPAGGTVTLAARNVRLPSPDIPEADFLAGDFVLLTVADDGPGMAPEVAAQAFEPFFTTKAIGEGSGLGLSQVYGFACQSGGTAWIRSDGGGTTISILLPKGGQDGTDARSHEHAARDGAERLQGIRVLCVEDDDTVGEMALELLTTLGCRAQAARNADEALQADLDAIDLVFSDVLMPGTMDGIGLAGEIRKRRPDLPVLLASGYVVAPERLQALGVHVLSKPYDMESLRRALLERLA